MSADRLRILVVVHGFPPRQQAGAELYAHGLSLELSRSHEIVVFSTDQSVFRRNYGRRRYVVDGLTVFEVVNQRRYSDFAETYADPRMEQHFVDVLGRVRPDVVHFQHLLHHSIRYPELARERGIPSVMTLHEYWLMCARNGQLIRADDSRCELPALDQCARCMSSFMWGRKTVDVWALRGLGALRSMTGLDLKAAARRVRLRRFADDRSVPQEVVDSMRQRLLIREARVRDALELVDCMVAPSEFLRDRFIAWGADPQRIIASDYGTDTSGFRRRIVRHDGDRPLEIGFLGSIQRVKGTHVLLEALQSLPRGAYRARIFGNVGVKPEYVAELARRCGDAIRLEGAIDHARIPEVLAEVDVLCVPSIWWENSPLVIHEAFAAGVPVVCSGIGGMAELVEHDVSGLHFRPNEPDDLARQLRRLLDEPGLVERLSRGIGEIPSIAQDAAFHDELFRAIVDAYR